MENVVRGHMEDIHARNELTGEDMKNMNIKLRNNIYTYLIDNNLKVNRINLFNLLVDVLDEYKDKVQNQNEFLDNIKDSVKDIIYIIKNHKKKPELLEVLKGYYSQFNYEPPVYLN